MGVGADLSTFCGDLEVNNRSSISDRYELITRRVNLECWNSDPRLNHSLYAGSYGRHTAIGSTRAIRHATSDSAACSPCSIIDVPCLRIVDAGQLPQVALKAALQGPVCEHRDRGSNLRPCPTVNAMISGSPPQLLHVRFEQPAERSMGWAYPARSRSRAESTVSRRNQ